MVIKIKKNWCLPKKLRQIGKGHIHRKLGLFIFPIRKFWPWVYYLKTQEMFVYLSFNSVLFQYVCYCGTFPRYGIAIYKLPNVGTVFNYQSSGASYKKASQSSVNWKKEMTSYSILKLDFAWNFTVFNLYQRVQLLRFAGHIYLFCKLFSANYCNIMQHAYTIFKNIPTK